MPPTDYRFKLGDKVYIIRHLILSIGKLTVNTCITECEITGINDRKEIVGYSLVYGKKVRRGCFREDADVYKTFDDAKQALIGHELTNLENALNCLRAYENIKLEDDPE